MVQQLVALKALTHALKLQVDGIGLVVQWAQHTDNRRMQDQKEMNAHASELFDAVCKSFT